MLHCCWLSWLHCPALLTVLHCWTKQSELGWVRQRCWLMEGRAGLHSCLHSGSEKQSEPELTEDLTRVQEREGEEGKSWGSGRAGWLRVTNINSRD